MEIGRIGPAAIAACRGLFAGFFRFSSQVVTCALDTPRRVPIVPRTITEPLAREALCRAGGFIEFYENVDVKVEV